MSMNLEKAIFKPLCDYFLDFKVHVDELILSSKIRSASNVSIPLLLFLDVVKFDPYPRNR